ncbi:unnamed protein product [Medioppia subpectinata]|uniref:PDZ GRASP-type domain-containing protein n=1 Tax=Medioppia subpectinata TaxID=1979941 RepID=A0A7R9KVU8_9ACAR|nr:unnamed protein product [Medioppia subpectinata]CAG2110805.1 unnamed protein product [Medioppia subpectinata]
MGGSQSIEVPGGGTEGYHVLRVQDYSPGHKAGLEAYFDFIIAIGNTRLNQDNDALKEILKTSIDKPLVMTVYNSKTQTVREVELTPSAKWGGQGLLGVSIRFCSFEGANEHVWHVLQVEANSPAHIAGLKSDTDYIIGADSVLQESEDLFSLIEAHEGKPLKLFVYNLTTDSCRDVTIVPNSNWGGEGSLGCGIGYGYLHRIPYREEPKVKETTASQEPKNIPQSTPEATPISQTHYSDRKYELQQQPQSQPPPPQQQSQQYSSPMVANTPVVVHDHKHQQEVFNAHIGITATPTPPTPAAQITSTPISSLSSNLANISLGQGGDQYSTYNQLNTSTSTTPSGSYPLPATLPVSQIGTTDTYGAQRTSPFTPSYGYNQSNYNMNTSPGVNPLATYGGQSFTTPISLPGMPPKYELQQQPQSQPPPPQQQSQQYSSPMVPNTPVVVHDHKHQQEVFNANIGITATPTPPTPAAHITSTPISSLSSNLANISLGQGGDQYSTYNQLNTSTSTTPSGSYPLPATLPVSQIGTTDTYGAQRTSPYTPSYGYNQSNYNMNTSPGVNPLATYGGQSFTTPISLPGMPPLTVSATLPTDKFSVPFANTYSEQQYNPNTNQSVGYPLDPNQTYSPQL